MTKILSQNTAGTIALFVAFDVISLLSVHMLSNWVRDLISKGAKGKEAKQQRRRKRPPRTLKSFPLISVEIELHEIKGRLCSLEQEVKKKDMRSMTDES